jgi:ATP-dependent protease HslVU (ClpYQ) peptidase subunit
MTCIVGLEHEGRVYLAGDTQGTGGNYKARYTEPKVFMRGSVGFGYTSSYRFGQILEYILPEPVVPNDKKDIPKWLIGTLIPDIKKALKDSGYDEGGTCLIAVKGTLWELHDDFCVLRPSCGYSAVGSGHEYAKGAMFMSLGYLEKDPSTLVKKAVLAAGQFSPTVGIDVTSIIID